MHHLGLESHVSRDERREINDGGYLMGARLSCNRVWMHQNGQERKSNVFEARLLQPVLA